LPKKIPKTPPKLPEVKIEKKKEKPKKEQVQRPELSEQVVQVDRVARVVAGGVIGDRSGKVGIGVSKAADVVSAIGKAKKIAQKNMISVPIINDTIPHPIRQNFGAAKIILKPASKGTGIIAGGPVRIIADLAGIKNISAKILGSDNKINNLKATILALQNLRTKRER